MELTLDIILYQLNNLNRTYTKRSPKEQDFTGLRQLYPSNSELIFSTSNLYLSDLSVVWRMRKSLNDRMSILANGDADFTQDQLKEIPCALVVFEIEGGLSQLMNRVLQIIEEFSEWDKTMHIASLEGKSIQELVDYSCNLLTEPILIFDPSFDVLAYAKGRDSEYTAFVETTSKGYTASTIMEHVRDLQVFQKLEKDNNLTVADAAGAPSKQVIYMRFQSGGSVLGFGSIYIGDKTPNQGYLDMVRLFMQNLTLCFQRDYEKNHYGQMMYETFLMNLIHAENLPTKQLEEQLSNIGSLSRYGVMTLGVLQFSSKIKVPQTFLARFLAREFSDYHVFLNEDHICMLKYFDSEEPVEFTDLEQGHLAGALTNYKYTMGISNVFYDIADLRFAWKEARSAVEQTSKNGKILGYYSDYLYEDIFQTMNDILPVRLLRANCYERLRTYDLQHKTNYCQMILTYLENDCNASHTAEKMYLHRNTIYKAVQFVQHELGIDLGNTHTKELLVLSYLADQFSGQE